MGTRSKQQAAVDAAHELAEIMKLATALRDRGAAFVTKYNKEVYSTTWGNMATQPYVAVNDGTTTGVNDANPVATNPIVVGAIFRSKNQLVSAVTLLNQLANFFGNVAVIQGDYSQNAEDLAS